MTSIVPQANHRLGKVVLVPERAQARRAQQEESAGARFETEPTRGEHPQEMPARKQQHVRLEAAHLAHHAIGPGTDLLWRLSARAAVAEQVPAGALGVNLGSTAA